MVTSVNELETNVRETITYLEVREAADGATVYLVKVVGAIDTSVITSTLCSSVSSTPKNAS